MKNFVKQEQFGIYFLMFLIYPPDLSKIDRGTIHRTIFGGNLDLCSKVTWNAGSGNFLMYNLTMKPFSKIHPNWELPISSFPKA